jgi:hypothetical protein
MGKNLTNQNHFNHNGYVEINLFKMMNGLFDTYSNWVFFKNIFQKKNAKFSSSALHQLHPHFQQNNTSLLQPL